MTTYQVGLLEGEELRKWWPNILESIEMSPPSWIKRVGEHNLKALVDDGTIFVWGCGVGEKLELLMMTRVIELGSKYLVVEFMTGQNLDTLLPAIDTAVEYCAAAQGCDEIVVKGRAGWKKKLEPLGFRMHSIEMARPVRRTRH